LDYLFVRDLQHCWGRFILSIGKFNAGRGKLLPSRAEHRIQAQLSPSLANEKILAGALSLRAREKATSMRCKEDDCGQVFNNKRWVQVSENSIHMKPAMHRRKSRSAFICHKWCFRLPAGGERIPMRESRYFKAFAKRHRLLHFAKAEAFQPCRHLPS
jgi:hypothetical protein